MVTPMLQNSTTYIYVQQAIFIFSILYLYSTIRIFQIIFIQQKYSFNFNQNNFIQQRLFNFNPNVLLSKDKLNLWKNEFWKFDFVSELEFDVNN